MPLPLHSIISSPLEQKKHCNLNLQRLSGCFSYAPSPLQKSWMLPGNKAAYEPVVTWSEYYKMPWTTIHEPVGAFGYCGYKAKMLCYVWEEYSGNVVRFKFSDAVFTSRLHALHTASWSYIFCVCISVYASTLITCAVIMSHTLLLCNFTFSRPRQFRWLLCVATMYE